MILERKVPTIATMAAPALASFDMMMAWTGLRGSIFIGPMLALGTPAPVTASAQSYRFRMNSFQIEQTRSRHEDTDFAAIAVAVGKGAPVPLSKPMGNVNNGSYQVDLEIDLKVADNEPAVMSYSIMNAGHSAANTVEGLLTKAGNALAEEVVSKIEEAVLEGIFDAALPVTVFEMALPMIGSALDKLADWLVQQLADVINADCDGPVAAAVHGFSGLYLREQTASDKIYEPTDVNHGTPSADGCGSGTSLYNVIRSLEAV